MKRPIATVLVYMNGMVVVFDTTDHQLPKYQGRYVEVRDSILSDAPMDARFFHGQWFRGNPPEITRAEFAELQFSSSASSATSAVKGVSQ